MAFPKLDDIISQVVDNVNQNEPLAQAPDQAPAPTEAPPPVETQAPEQAPEQELTPQEQKILDLKELVKDQKFKLDDKEFTLDDLKKHMMRDADYRRKTQEISAIKKEHESLKGEQKYWDNLQHDLALVKSNPQLASEFLKTYPEKFHQFVSEFAPQETHFSEAAILQKVQSLLQREINPLRESITEREKAATIAEWQNWDTQMKSQFNLAQPEHVEAVLQQALSQGTPPSKELWEQAYKLSHDKMDGLKKQWLSENVQKTKTLNNQAKDTKAGGSIPGQVPEKISLKDAGKRMAENFGIQL